jgi:hypothetical protein
VEFISSFEHLDWSQLFSALQQTGAYALPRVSLALLLILIALLLTSAIYRSTARSEEVEFPVSLSLLTKIEKDELILAPKHLRESTVHQGKAPRVEFYLQLPNTQQYSRLMTKRPLKIIVRGRNSANVHDSTYEEKSQDGGQVGISSEVRDAIEEKLQEIYRKEGRRLDADTASFRIKMKYPSRFNISYLLIEHPDTSVRVASWLFMLTSLYGILQDVAFKFFDFLGTA